MFSIVDTDMDWCLSIVHSLPVVLLICTTMLYLINFCAAVTFLVDCGTWSPPR